MWIGYPFTPHLYQIFTPLCENVTNCSILELSTLCLILPVEIPRCTICRILVETRSRSLGELSGTLVGELFA
jgi:hypothetical protein